MCLFKYREKRYGKLAFIIFALCVIALAGVAIWGGVYAVLNMSHWAKYVIVSVAGVVGFALLCFGVFLILFSFSLIWKNKSVRDVNKSKGVADVRLCDKCGRVITKKAEFCEHCGEKQQTGLGLKVCPECKTKNSGAAAFCEKCGYEFKN